MFRFSLVIVLLSSFLLFSSQHKKSVSGGYYAASIPVCGIEEAEEGLTSTGGPSITILSPKDGSMVISPFKVAFQVKNWAVGEDTTHIHWILEELNAEGAVANLQIGIHRNLKPIVFEEVNPKTRYTVKLLLMQTNHKSIGKFAKVSVQVK
ncbi:hypothetical protein AAG747_11665 [Rapidithrix thailandica]|uniref:Uncharacterized protein n=1 Tax=Rapidithrix thailandica TaxID=413964 RepID=A0AAW9S4Y8_9BACT